MIAKLRKIGGFMKIKKSVRFQKLIPKIRKYLEQGYTYDAVISLLKNKHDLELKRGTFNSYMTRFYFDKKTKQEPIATEKPKQLEPVREIEPTADVEDEELGLDELLTLASVKNNTKIRSIFDK